MCIEEDSPALDPAPSGERTGGTDAAAVPTFSLDEALVDVTGVEVLPGLDEVPVEDC